MNIKKQVLGVKEPTVQEPENNGTTRPKNLSANRSVRGLCSRDRWKVPNGIRDLGSSDEGSLRTQEKISTNPGQCVRRKRAYGTVVEPTGNPLFQLVLPRVRFYLFDRAWIVFAPPIVFWLSRAQRHRLLCSFLGSLHGVLANQGGHHAVLRKPGSNKPSRGRASPVALSLNWGHLSFDTGLAVQTLPTLEHRRHGSAPGVGG